MTLNDRDLLESRLQIETVRHAEDRVSSMPALCNAKCWTCANIKCVIFSLLDNEVVAYLLNIVARDVSRFVTNLIRRERERETR